MSVEVLCFRFLSSSEQFNPSIKEEVNWNKRDAKSLSIALINQINNNYIDLESEAFLSVMLTTKFYSFM